MRIPTTQISCPRTECAGHGNLSALCCSSQTGNFFQVYIFDSRIIITIIIFKGRALLEGRGGEGVILPFCLSPAEATSRALCPAWALQYKRDVDILLQVQQRPQGQ